MQRVSRVEFEPRAMCLRCERPERVCLCAHIRPVWTRTRVLILQHPRESTVPIGTARLAELGLTSVERQVGVKFADHTRVQQVLADTEAPPVLLFPGEHSRDLRSDPPERPVTLVVIDGTWWQAEKIFKQNPSLQRLPQYRLCPAQPSRYRIRRAPSRDFISTIEAIVEALSLLEGPGCGIEAALEPFDALVEQQLGFAAERRARRHRAGDKTNKARRPAAVLGARATDLLVGYGEANAWPRGSPLGAHPELVHWAAQRLESGERFEAFIAPENQLSPTFHCHNGLSRERVLSGETRASFAGRWREFVRHSDLLCSWGFYAAERLFDASRLRTEQLDLRHVALTFLQRKPGDVLECAAALGESPELPWVSGRTGIRLAGLTAVARALLRASRTEPQFSALAPG